MTWSVENLPWLPVAPEGFRARCKAIDSLDADRGAALLALARHSLDVNKLARLAKSLDLMGADVLPLKSFKLGLLSNATTDLLVPVLRGTALRHGLALQVISAPFDQAIQSALDPGSEINTGEPDAVLVALDHRGLGLKSDLSGSVDSARDQVTRALEHVEKIRRGLAAGCGAPVIIQTVAEVPETLFGSLDARLAGTLRNIVDAFNRGLVENIEGSVDLILDVAGLARAVGSEAWHDPTQWYLAKLPHSQRFSPIYADHAARLIGALRGQSRKCLVLDLDNTVWGGVIGDDGLEGIVLGHGDPVGEAFLAVQRMALDLRDRGVVLAVSSKNEDANARLPFRSHPDMLLREDDIAVFQANWIDKPANLRAIAKTLNIGTDTLVLLDDNPAERAIVRRELPEIAVPELPEDAALYPRTLLSAGYFEAVTFSADDRARHGQYQANSKRAELAESNTDMDSYLASLDMTIRFAPFDAISRSRIAQLINKSNQFNLTTKRYTEADVASMDDDTDLFTLQVRLEDCFGDNGMISVVICRKQDAFWDIETWLMSCRVLGRKVEQAVLQEIASRASNDGATELRGCFVPTGRNELVADHYESLGFSAAGEQGDNTLWSLNLNDFHTDPPPMKVVRADG